MNLFRSLLFIMILSFLSGCVSKPVENENEYAPPPLVIAQNSDGDVNIGWESDPGYVYTVFYQSSAGADWKALNEAYRVPGTGQMLTVYDHVNPNRPPHRYRILPEKQ